jgi:iron complex outermembrane recepter protein
MKKTQIALRCGTAAFAVMLAGAAAVSPAMAQDATQTDTAASDDTPEIVVTGSRITNPNLVQSSPINVIGENEIQLRQSTNAEELIGRLPGVTAGINAGVNNGSAGYSSFNLRGLGDNRNLVLLDGNRIVPASLDGVTDLNNIPVALIQRVDIVTGGASSVYGADAVAGVVNFITKRDFSGVDLQTSLGINEAGDGERFRADLTMGGNFAEGRGNAVFAVGYQKVNPVLQGDRDFSAETLNIDGSLVGSGTAVPTRINGQQYDPATGGLRATYSTFNFAPSNYFQTPLERFNAYGSAHYEVADDIEVYSTGMFNKTTVKLQLAPSGLFGDTYQLPLNNAFLTSGVQSALCTTNATRIAAAGYADCNAAIADGFEVPTTINRRFVEMGARETDYVTNQFQFVGGVRGNVNSRIKFDVHGAYGESDKSQTDTNWGLKSRVQQALRTTSTTACVDTSNGCAPINLFGDGQAISADTIAFINASALSSVKTTLGVVNASLSGNLTDKGFLWAETPIGFAIGGEYRRYTASQISDAASSTQDEVLGSGAPSPSFTGGYSVKELFSELIVPIVENVPGIYNLTFEGGLRYSHYSTAGDTWTYKAGGSYEPIQGLRFRGIYQRAVRAPNISELYLPVTTGLSNLAVDPCAGANPVGNATLTAICIAQGAPSSTIGSIPQPSAGQINATSGGNTALKPETADTYTLGMVFTPAAVRGLAITVDYYKIKVTDAITNPTANDILDPCYEQNDAAACALIGRNPLNGSLNGGGDTPGLLLNLTNQGTLVSSGIDARINYRMDTSFGGLDFDVSANWTNEYKFQASPTSDMRECVGQYGVSCDPLIPEFSFNARATARVNKIGDFSLFWRWMDGVKYEDQSDTDVLDDYKSISPYSYFDLTMRTEVSKNFNITFSVMNILDKTPPVVSQYIGSTTYNSGNTYPATYDALGRRYMITTGISF